MTWPRLIAVILSAWALTTCGLAMAFGSWAVVPLSAGLTLGAWAFIDLRAKVADEMTKKDEATK